MSGGHFDYQQYRMRDIADTIEYDIARALQPKPAMVHEDYWIIDVMFDSLHSSQSLSHYRQFKTYEDAESYLMAYDVVIKAEQKYIDVASMFRNGIIFQSTKLNMTIEPNPVLYSIRHCV